MNLLWKGCVPSKVNFFVWEVWWGKVLTMEQIKRGAFNWLAGALYAVMLKKTWTTSYFNALRRGDCGKPLLPSLVSSELVPWL